MHFLSKIFNWSYKCIQSTGRAVQSPPESATGQPDSSWIDEVLMINHISAEWSRTTRLA